MYVLRLKGNADARSRPVFSFHRPEELIRLAKLDEQVRTRLREIALLDTGNLWRVQIDSVQNLETSLAANRPRALIQMATGSVERDVILRVLEKCPNWQWRTVVALARFGGLRCPSEIALLKWSDIHWDTERFSVTSMKTERYGKATRVVPIFPELRGFLDEAFSMAAEGEQRVVPMLAGNADKNLGTTFRKIIRRAGEDPWPKPFQDCRFSRQTELEQRLPTYVVCSWLGNTPTIAHKHYLTVTEEHYSAAVKTGDKLGTQRPAASCTKAQKKSCTIHSYSAGKCDFLGSCGHP